MEIQNYEILHNTAFADYAAKTLEDRLQWFKTSSSDPGNRCSRTVEIGIAIHRDYHRKGVGRKTVKHLIELAKNLGYDHMIEGIMHKFDRDLDDVYMQMPLQDGGTIKTELEIPKFAMDSKLNVDAPGYDVRDAGEQDFASVIEIYNWEILNGTLTGDVEAKNVEQAVPFCGIAGYGMLPVHVPREGFFRTREISFFIHHQHKHTNVGYMLVNELIQRAKSYGFRDLLCMPEASNSQHLEILQRIGFQVQGFVSGVGTKLGHDLDIVYLQLRMW
ncbi:hypothetical protein BC829DRAFT_490143 [Chytridium lagenaria]|nr:hypothetical protein BC829DRAFT_490143 [Chytridium lagenaria]